MKIIWDLLREIKGELGVEVLDERNNEEEELEEVKKDRKGLDSPWEESPERDCEKEDLDW